MSDRVLVALDVASRDEATELLSHFKEQKPSIKIGMELFYQEGPELIKELKSEGYFIFLDLKLHDIPTTVQKAMRGIARLGVDMINVHAAGGSEMMKAAMVGLDEGTSFGQKRPICLAVTQLTSTDQAMLERELLIERPIEKVIESYSKTAYENGLDGVVCSPWESQIVKTATSDEFLTVTPGIRLAGTDVNDQKRIATPEKARALGSDYIVVGRSITAASNIQTAYSQVITEWRNANVHTQ